MESVNSPHSCHFPPIPAMRILVVPSFFLSKNSLEIIGVKVGVELGFPDEIERNKKFQANTPIKRRLALVITIPIIILLIHFFSEGARGVSVSLGIGAGEEGSFLVLNADMRLIIEKKVVFSKEKWVFHKYLTSIF